MDNNVLSKLKEDEIIYIYCGLCEGKELIMPARVQCHSFCGKKEFCIGISRGRYMMLKEVNYKKTWWFKEDKSE